VDNGLRLQCSSAAGNKAWAKRGSARLFLSSHFKSEFRRYEMLVLITNLMHDFIYSIIIYYIVILNMFRASLCSSSGGKIIYLQYLVSSHSVRCHTVHRLIGALYGSVQSVTIPDTVNIQSLLLKMSTTMLKIC
jgi:hypothetical protein